MTVINRPSRIRATSVEEADTVPDMLTMLRYLLVDCQHVISRNDPGGDQLRSYIFKLLPILDRNIKRLAREVAKAGGPDSGRHDTTTSE